MSKGGSIAPIWSPIEQLLVTLEFSREDQDYIGSGVTAATVAPRSDKLRTEKLMATYKPYRVLQIDLSYKYERRASDEAIFEYNDKLATLKFQLIF